MFFANFPSRWQPDFQFETTEREMAFSIASICCFFQNENESISRGENPYQSKLVEAFMYSPGVLKGNICISYYWIFFFYMKTIYSLFCGIGFPLVNLVCVEPKIGCYVTSHFSTLSTRIESSQRQ